jgi:hypothetical protein
MNLLFFMNPVSSSIVKQTIAPNTPVTIEDDSFGASLE